MKKVCERLSVAAGGLHASVDWEICANVGDEPGEELGMPFKGIGEFASGDEILGLEALDGDMIIRLGDVDPQIEFEV